MTPSQIERARDNIRLSTGFLMGEQDELAEMGLALLGLLDEMEELDLEEDYHFLWDEEQWTARIHKHECPEVETDQNGHRAMAG